MDIMYSEQIFINLSGGTPVATFSKHLVCRNMTMILY